MRVNINGIEDIKKFKALIKLAVSKGFNTVGEFEKFIIVNNS